MKNIKTLIDNSLKDLKFKPDNLKNYKLSSSTFKNQIQNSLKKLKLWKMLRLKYYKRKSEKLIKLFIFNNLVDNGIQIGNKNKKLMLKQLSLIKILVKIHQLKKVNINLTLKLNQVDYNLVENI